MFSRIRRSPLALLLFLLCSSIITLRGESPAEAAAEAERLYSRANDYVTNITEKGFSYAYIQFYWKRAQNNLDRVIRVYPNTPTGKKLLADDVKVGGFELTYFKERVLPRLEVKRLAAFDAVNCAIFLYNLDETRWDAQRTAALESILEVLSRQQRWNEALSFPVLDEHKPLLFTTVFRVAARYKQQKLVDELILNAAPAIKPLYWPILGEALALTGAPREEIAQFLDEHAEPNVRLAVLSGMVDREIAIQHAALLRLDVKKGIQKTHYSVLNPDVRDDIESVAKTFFPQPTAESRSLVGKYHAALGRKPAASASAVEHMAYLEYLAITQNFDQLARYLPETKIPGNARQPCELKLIELYAQEGREKESRAFRTPYDSAGGVLADTAALAEFRGRMHSSEIPLTVRDRTFSELSIKDPLITAQAIMEWSLTPNRAIRGPAPYDSVVQKYLPGFENLPLPQSKDVQEASSTSKPF
jgi:hypothetical protein